MTTLKYNALDEADVKKVFNILSVKHGLDRETVLSIMANNPIVVSNGDQWEVELNKNVQVYEEWQADIWVTRGKKIKHNDIVYNIIQSHQTQFEPQTVPALFRPAPVQYPGETYPRWRQPLDSEDAYKIDERVTHNSIDWKSNVAANVFEPGVSQWTNLTTPPVGYPAWVQPVGAQDAYALGARVKHNGFDWESTNASNVWEPGVFGWIKL